MSGRGFKCAFKLVFLHDIVSRVLLIMSQPFFGGWQLRRPMRMKSESDISLKLQGGSRDAIPRTKSLNNREELHDSITQRS